MPLPPDGLTSTPALAEALRALSAAQLSAGAARATLSIAQARAFAREFGCGVGEVERQALVSGVAPLRYERNLGTIQMAGQARLLRAAVAVVGCGGLGGWVIEGLARMGVGHLILIDSDCFEESNLNRQLGCLEHTVGRHKAPCLAERVRAVNSAVTTTVHVERLIRENAAVLLEGAEVVVDALDTIPDRLVLARAARAAGLPMVHGAIGGYSGQVMTILPGDPGLEALYSGAHVPARGVETGLGNPAATPMMVAAWQVQEVVKLLVGEGALLRGRLLVLDAEYAEATEIRLS